MNKILFRVALFFSLTLFSGCASQQLVKYSGSTCNTTIEGNYYKKPVLKSYPAIFLKLSDGPRILTGKIISIDSSGVVFDYTNLGFERMEKKYYPFDTLACVVDDSGKVLYGEIPPKYAIIHKLALEIENESGDRYNLILEPNEPFSYCIEPGNYTITEIKFYDDKRKELYDDYLSLSFKIDEGKVNYLGNIYGDYKTKRDSNVIVLPCNGEYLSGVPFLDFLNSMESNQHFESEHVINIEYDSNFLPELKNQLVEIPIEIK